MSGACRGLPAGIRTGQVHASLPATIGRGEPVLLRTAGGIDQFHDAEVGGG
jgi:hypothetical protein